MADVLRIKRRVGGGPGAPSSLANAELAYNEVDHTLYYGEGTGGAGGSATVVVPIGGQGLGSAATPLMDGAAAVGTANTYARGDHVHPVDTSRAPLNSPALTGTPTAPTATPGTDNTTKIATTAFVQSAISAVSGGVTSIAAANGLSASAPSGAVTIGITANGILNASLATMPAHTFKGNNTGATATSIDLTIAQVMADLGAAPLNSPSFTGVPSTAASPANGDNSLKLATTAYVMATRIDQLQPPNVDVPWNNKRITGLLAPSAAQDAATKAYVDGISQGLDAKGSCVVATTANIALTGAQTIDGWSVQTGDRVLVKNQTTTTENGIYTGNTIGAWARASDADTWTELVSAFTFVEQGPANADSGWLCTVDAAGTIGSTPVTWVQFSGAGQISAGNGLTKTGNILDVVGTASRISVLSDSIDIDAAYIGQNTITTVGTITSGAWSANTIAVNKGGTGATSLTGYVKGSGTSPLTASATIPNTDITGLGTMATQAASAVAITGGTIDGVTFDFGTF
jgi:hypothetical protein